MELAAALAQAGGSADAMRVLRTVLALPVNAAARLDAHTALAVLLDQTEGRLEQAEYHFRAALAVNPAYAPALLNLANCVWQQYRLQEALALFRRAAAQQPDESEYAYSLAAAHFELGVAEEARLGFMRAIQLEPDNHHALKGLGVPLVPAACVPATLASESLHTVSFSCQHIPPAYALVCRRP